jgi:hypothetical protein
MEIDGGGRSTSFAPTLPSRNFRTTGDSVNCRPLLRPVSSELDDLPVLEIAQ